MCAGVWCFILTAILFADVGVCAAAFVGVCGGASACVGVGVGASVW